MTNITLALLDAKYALLMVPQHGEMKSEPTEEVKSFIKNKEKNGSWISRRGPECVVTEALCQV